MLSGEPEIQRSLLLEQLDRALGHPKFSAEEHPQLLAIQRYLKDLKDSSRSKIESTVPILNVEQITALRRELRSQLPRPTLNSDSQAYVRVLSLSSSTTAELKKIQKLGAKKLSPMTLVGKHAKFSVYDHDIWRNRSGLLFNTSTTRHVAGHKSAFNSNRLAQQLKEPTQKTAYKQAFSADQAGDTQELYGLVNEALDESLSKLTTLRQKYVEMDARRKGNLNDSSSKHELVDFLKRHCELNEKDIEPFDNYRSLFNLKIFLVSDIEKRKRLSEAAAKLTQRDHNAQINYLTRGAQTPKYVKYRDRIAFRPNENLCLPKEEDVEGVYVHLSNSGIEHAISIHDALINENFASDQQRIYAYQPNIGLTLTSKEEIVSLQGIVQAIELNKDRDEILSLISTHQTKFTSPDSHNLLQCAMVKAPTKDSAIFQPCFDFSKLSSELKRSFLGDASSHKNYSMTRALFDSMPAPTKQQVLDEFHNLPGVIASFANDPKGLSELRGLIDSRSIEINAQGSGRSNGLVQNAARGGHVEALPVLKAWGVNMDQTDREGCTAAHLAAFDNSPEVIMGLAQCDAFLDAPNSEGESPAHLAAKRGSTAAMKALIECGANINPHDHCGQTPALVAARYKNAGVIKLLAEQGVDLSEKLNRSLSKNDEEDFAAPQSPLEWARYHRHGDTLDALHRYAGIFDSRDYQQKTLEKKLVLCISAIKHGTDPQDTLNSIPGLRDYLADPANKQRFYDRLLASGSFSYKSQSTLNLFSRSTSITPEERIKLINALGDNHIVSSPEQERKKISDLCCTPGHIQAAQQKIKNYIETRCAYAKKNPDLKLHPQSPLATDLQSIDEWFCHLEISSGQDFESEKLDLKRPLLEALYTAAANSPARIEALSDFYQSTPDFSGKQKLWNDVTSGPLVSPGLGLLVGQLP